MAAKVILLLEFFRVFSREGLPAGACDRWRSHRADLLQGSAPAVRASRLLRCPDLCQRSAHTTRSFCLPFGEVPFPAPQFFKHAHRCNLIPPLCSRAVARITQPMTTCYVLHKMSTSLLFTSNRQRQTSFCSLRAAIRDKLRPQVREHHGNVRDLTKAV